MMCVSSLIFTVYEILQDLFLKKKHLFTNFQSTFQFRIPIFLLVNFFLNSFSILEHTTQITSSIFQIVFPSARYSIIRSKSKSSSMSSGSKSKPARFKCRECDVTFSRKSNLYRHESGHNGKIYPCKVCGRSFTRYDILVTHQKRMHKKKARSSRTSAHRKNKQPPPNRFENGNVPAHSPPTDPSLSLRQSSPSPQPNRRGVGNRTDPACSPPMESLRLCPRPSRQSSPSPQPNPQSIGNGIDPACSPPKHSREPERFKCRECGISFSRKSNLRRHESGHNGKIHHCEICGHSSARYDGLVDHQKRMHKEMARLLTSARQRNQQPPPNRFVNGIVPAHSLPTDPSLSFFRLILTRGDTGPEFISEEEKRRSNIGIDEYYFCRGQLRL
ncbi:hypothetical protein CAEBREN_26152 [Caenorhabditis brenneri]|uniref:C2H2-type domain-containing protein n=1 Tax=Caenorhabditis brenneri TaxID=135651 RepID=G0NUB0_CAEBE|nr:hypothetical protein CAEBREN_26152 [Caenorhabditis brenneri]